MATGRHVRKFRKESPRSSGSPATEFLKKPVLARSPVGPPPALNQSGPTETRHRELDRSPRGLLSQAHHNPTSPSSSYSSSRKRPPAKPSLDRIVGPTSRYRREILRRRCRRRTWRSPAK